MECGLGGGGEEGVEAWVAPDVRSKSGCGCANRAQVWGVVEGGTGVDDGVDKEGDKADTARGKGDGDCK